MPASGKIDMAVVAVVVICTHVGVEKTQDELEVRLLSGDERHAGRLALGVDCLAMFTTRSQFDV